MVFLQDTLDVLLEILMNSSTDDDSDNKVFEALASISVCCYCLLFSRINVALKYSVQA